MATKATKKPGKPRKQRAARADLYLSPSYVRLQRRLADRVLALRTDRGWTQEQAAHEAGMSTRLWQRVEGAEANLSLVTLARVVDALGVDPEVLFARVRPRP